MLDVKYLLDGSVRQDSTRVKITASLIDAARNTPVWTRDFASDRRDVMALQRDVALAIAQALQVTLTPRDQARLAPARAPNPEAFDLYLKGTHFRDTANITGEYAKAASYLAAAIAKDSGYAAAYAGLASVYAVPTTPSAHVRSARRHWPSIRPSPKLTWSAEYPAVPGLGLEGIGAVASGLRFVSTRASRKRIMSSACCFSE